MSSEYESLPRAAGEGREGAPNVSVTVALCLLCAVLEGFDIQAMGVAAPRLWPEFGLDPDQMGSVFAVSNVGLVIGAALGGWLADRVGRKAVFIGAVATFGVFTLGVALVFGPSRPDQARSFLGCQQRDHRGPEALRRGFRQ